VYQGEDPVVVLVGLRRRRTIMVSTTKSQGCEMKPSENVWFSSTPLFRRIFCTCIASAGGSAVSGRADGRTDGRTDGEGTTKANAIFREQHIFHFSPSRLASFQKKHEIQAFTVHSLPCVHWILLFKALQQEQSSGSPSEAISVSRPQGQQR